MLSFNFLCGLYVLYKYIRPFFYSNANTTLMSQTFSFPIINDSLSYKIRILARSFQSNNRKRIQPN